MSKTPLIGPCFRIPDWFLMLGGVFSWVGTTESSGKWWHFSGNLLFRTLDPDPCVNSLVWMNCSRPIGSFDYWVSLVLDPSVNQPLGSSFMEWTQVQNTLLVSWATTWWLRFIEGFKSLPSFGYGGFKLRGSLTMPPMWIKLPMKWRVLSGVSRSR